MRLPLLLAALALLPAPAAPPPDFLPPAPPWHGASEALIAKPGNPWITPAEKMGLLDSPNYDDTIAWLKKLCAASPLLELQPFGQTAQGRKLYVVVATKENPSCPRRCAPAAGPRSSPRAASTPARSTARTPA